MVQKVIGIDPGTTTGWCVVERRPDRVLDIVAYGEIPLDRLPSDLEAVMNRYSPEVAVIERVVASGQLTPDKFKQIQAYDRCWCTVVTGLPTVRSVVKEINPEERKTVKSRPSGIHGIHARDAYRIAAAYINQEESKR